MRALPFGTASQIPSIVPVYVVGTDVKVSVRAEVEESRTNSVSL